MTIDDSDPIDTSGDALSLTQTCWTVEAEGYDSSNDIFAGPNLVSDGSYSDGEALAFDNAGTSVDSQWVEFYFTTGHTIPSGEFVVDMRAASSGFSHQVEIQLDVGQTSDFTTLQTLAFAGSTSLTWISGADVTTPPEIPSGTHTLRIERSTLNDTDLILDVVAPNDSRFSYTFDNTVHTTNGYLDGPQWFPDVVPVQLTTTETRRDVTEATAEIDTNTTDANQYVELRIGSDAFDRTNNAASASTTGGPARSIDVTLGLTRYPDDSNPQSATPRFGYNGQSVDSYSLHSNPDAINASGVGEAEVDAIVGEGEITGDRIEEAAELTSGGTALTRSILAPFDVFAETSLRSSEKVSFSNDE